MSFCGERSTIHFITACPQRLKIPNAGAARPPPPPRKGLVPFLCQGPLYSPVRGLNPHFDKGLRL